MTTTDALAVIKSLNHQMEVNLKTIAEWQNNLSEWDELKEEDKPRFSMPNKPMEKEDLIGMLGIITEETKSIFAALIAHNKALIESIQDKELAIYIV